MDDGRQWLIAAGILMVFIPFAVWAGIAGGRSMAKKYPSAAAALWILGTFLKIDPPPPPKAERVTKDEETAGDPPKV